MQGLRGKLGVKWKQFVRIVGKGTEEEDRNVIFLEKFVDILKNNYSINLSDSDQTTLVTGFPAKSEVRGRKLNISHVLSLQNTSHIKRLYKTINLNEDAPLDDNDYADMYGYIGKFYRG